MTSRYVSKDAIGGLRSSGFAVSHRERQNWIESTSQPTSTDRCSSISLGVPLTILRLLFVRVTYELDVLCEHALSRRELHFKHKQVLSASQVLEHAAQERVKGPSVIAMGLHGLGK
jgi:hypothetical protein